MTDESSPETKLAAIRAETVRRILLLLRGYRVDEAKVLLRAETVRRILLLLRGYRVDEAKVLLAEALTTFEKDVAESAKTLALMREAK